MGIVNVTPDSFSDGGRYFSPEEAVRRARNIIAEGADIVDLGGESTRPGAKPISWQEEWARIEPVLRDLMPCAVPVSVDTYHPETAERAVDAGATIVNCVYSEPIPDMQRLLADRPVELVMPATAEPSDSAAWASRIYLDPMIGFGTTREEDLARLRALPELAKRGRVLVGASRKRIVKKLVCGIGGAKGDGPVGKNVGGSVAIAAWCALNGASVVRVHDVRETVSAFRVLAALA